ncbi:Protein of unknown function [Pyronema omphalodes CBS 100304]|uniref:Uncharacterized protein n=1 Tax=Pyronema omphalodes (strain CBS 100304) TaxID=1076935 RepID=U4L5F9_PYROM|nr:Protein of unknown function [Pyronema omphalodes CBS 100304]
MLIFLFSYSKKLRIKKN